MEATFDIIQRFTVTGDIADGVIIEMTNGDSFLAKHFAAPVSPGRGFGDTRVLRIDRRLTVTGPKLKADGTPSWGTLGRKHYWLSEESTPIWVREISLSIENTHVPTIVIPRPRTLTEPS